MPPYGWMKKNKLDPASVKAHMDALSLPYTAQQIAELSTKTEMDALIAYTQQLGHAVEKPKAAGGFDLAAVNPFGGSPQAVAAGATLYAQNCSVCHGDEGHGGIGPVRSPRTSSSASPATAPTASTSPSSPGGSDAKKAIGRPGLPDGGMEAYGAQIPPDGIWKLVSFIRAQQHHEGSETPAIEKREHETGGKH